MRIFQNGLLYVSLFFAIISGVAQAKPEETKSRYGPIEIRSKPGTSLDDAFYLNGKRIYQANGNYVGIYRIYRLGAIDAIVVSSNCGGTACYLDSYAIVSTADGKKFNTSKMFGSLDGTFVITQSGETLGIDLGYENGARVTGQFYKEILTFKNTRSDMTPPMAKRDCDWLYDQYLDQCLQAKEKDSSCQNPEVTFAQVTLRGKYMMSHHPAYSSVKMDALCENVCKTSQVPSYTNFKESYCRIR